jgi:hypothetical protein
LINTKEQAVTKVKPLGSSMTFKDTDYMYSGGMQREPLVIFVSGYQARNQPNEDYGYKNYNVNISQEKQIKTLLKSIEDYGFLDLDENENPILVDQEGVPIVDSKTQTKVKFDDLVIAEWDSIVGFTAIDLDKKTPQPAAGNNKPTQQKTGIKFDSFEAAEKAIRMLSGQDRADAQRAMNAQFPNGPK